MVQHSMIDGGAGRTNTGTKTMFAWMNECVCMYEYRVPSEH